MKAPCSALVALNGQPDYEVYIVYFRGDVSNNSRFGRPQDCYSTNHETPRR